MKWEDFRIRNLNRLRSLTVSEESLKELVIIVEEEVKESVRLAIDKIIPLDEKCAENMILNNSLKEELEKI